MEEKALLQFVREKLADYKVPKRVVIMAALPRNATGKILKTALSSRRAGRENGRQSPSFSKNCGRTQQAFRGLRARMPARQRHAA